MSVREKYKNRVELVQGTLDMLILQTLRWSPRHGYAISQAIRAGSGEILRVETGSLYPALHRLERSGWIQSEWRSSEHNQRARYYQLTAAGRKQLTSERSRWGQVTGAITRLLNQKQSEGEA
jgi:PadR family transcriptional regulator PadR